MRHAVEELKAGRGCCVCLTGEAGIGKSRLALELSAEASGEGVLFLEGHTSEGQGSPPLVAWMEILRNLRAAVPPGRLRELLAPYAFVLARFLPDLPTWIGQPTSPSFPAGEVEQFQLFDAITQVLAELSREVPVILFLDDLHWADETSAQLLAYVHRNTLNNRILFLVSYRPAEVLQHGPSEDALFNIRRARRVQEILVGPLGMEETGQLAAGILTCERVDPSLASVLVERGGGNPFFVLELLSSMRQEGQIKVERGEAALTGSNVHLPGSIERLLRQRMARLSPSTREMLRMASVLGARLRPEVLAGMMGKEADAIVDLVDEALASGFVQEDPASPEGALVFGDDLFRKCLYETTSQTRRRVYHRLAGETLAALSETSADELGYHYAKAGVAHLACKYLEAAGDEALNLSSFKRASERFEEALQFLPGEDGEVHGRLLKKLGDAYRGAGKSREAREAYLRARQYVRSPAEDAAIGVRLAEVLVTMWDVPAVHQELEHTLRILGDAKTSDAAWAHNLHSFVLEDMDGDPEGSARAAERALEISSALDDREQFVQALDNLTWAHMLAGKWETALGALRYLEEAIKGGAKPEDLAARYISLGIYHDELFPDYSKAIEYYQRALETFRRTGNDSAAITAQHHLGSTCLRAGRWAEGEKNILAALAEASELPESRNEVPSIRVSLAVGMVRRGDFARAEREILAALGTREWYERLHGISFAHAVLAWVRAEAGNRPGARRAIREAFEAIQQHGGCGRCASHALPVAAYIESLDPGGDEQRFREAERRVAENGSAIAKAKMIVLAVRWARLRGAPSERRIEESVLFFRRMGDPFELATALYEHGCTLVALGSKSRAETCLDEADRIFSELQATKRLEDVRRVRQHLADNPLSG